MGWIYDVCQVVFITGLIYSVITIKKVNPRQSESSFIYFSQYYIIQTLNYLDSLSEIALLA